MSDGVPQASLCTTGPVSALIEELQYTLGEGPCIDAYRTGTAILEPDLAAPASPVGRHSPPRPSMRGPEQFSAFPYVLVSCGSAPSMYSEIGPAP
jgi:hypothetical protein